MGFFAFHEKNGGIGEVFQFHNILLKKFIFLKSMKKAILFILFLLPSTSYYMKANLEATESKAHAPVISPVEDQPIASDIELMHSLILLSDKVVANIHSYEKALEYTSLSDFLDNNLDLLNQKKLSIAVAKGTDYMNVIKVVDMMANLGIKNYQLVRYD